MQVNYRNRQIEKICTDASAATKKYGKGSVEKVGVAPDPK